MKTTKPIKALCCNWVIPAGTEITVGPECSKKRVYISIDGTYSVHKVKKSALK